LASCSYDDTIRLWKDDEQGDWFCFQVLGNHSSTVWAVDFDSTGDFLVSVSDDLSLRLYKLKNKQYEQVAVLENLHSRTIYTCSVKFPFIATGGGDDAICITKIIVDGTSLSLKLIERIENAHDFDVNTVCFSKNENLLASGGDDGIVKVWEFFQSQ
jgi:cytosolic iron-sulfur protein assembly protein CIAO1